MSRFAMACHSSTPDRWERMDEGAAASHWRPRASRDEAIKKCVEWTGRIGIPAMQVVDLDSGEVVWRDSRQYPEAGPMVPASRHEWERLTSGALDPSALEPGAERNLMLFADERHPAHDLPKCEQLEGMRRCGRESVGPFDHHCYRHFREELAHAWPVFDPARQLELWWDDGGVLRPCRWDVVYGEATA